MANPVERADDTDTGQMLTQHAVQFIQLDLNRLEQRQPLHADEENRADKQRNNHYKDQG
ncbi:hypothetical protein D3C73_1641070 [compost metagenome]